MKTSVAVALFTFGTLSYFVHGLFYLLICCPQVLYGGMDGRARVYELRLRAYQLLHFVHDLEANA